MGLTEGCQQLQRCKSEIASCLAHSVLHRTSSHPVRAPVQLLWFRLLASGRLEGQRPFSKGELLMVHHLSPGLPAPVDGARPARPHSWWGSPSPQVFKHQHSCLCQNKIMEKTNVFSKIVPPFVALNHRVSPVLLLRLALSTAGCSEYGGPLLLPRTDCPYNGQTLYIMTQYL